MPFAFVLPLWLRIIITPQSYVSFLSPVFLLFVLSGDHLEEKNKVDTLLIKVVHGSEFW